MGNPASQKTLSPMTLVITLDHSPLDSLQPLPVFGRGVPGGKCGHLGGLCKLPSCKGCCEEPPGRQWWIRTRSEDDFRVSRPCKDWGSRPHSRWLRTTEKQSQTRESGTLGSSNRLNELYASWFHMLCISVAKIDIFQCFYGHKALITLIMGYLIIWDP